MSHAALFNCLTTADRRAFQWEAGEQIQPITGAVKYFFTSQDYWESRQATKRRVVDHDG
jgi:hypothetical protein